jgi:hypothetical protein
MLMREDVSDHEKMKDGNTRIENTQVEETLSKNI